jgi:2'-5' RNA ligase
MRIFVSIDWSRATIAFLQEWQEKLQEDYGVRGYWRKPNNLHLTLKFLGEVAEAKISDINKVLKEVGVHYYPFNVILNELGVFPNIKAPRILWMGVQSPELFSIQSAIEGELSNIGVPPEFRRYQPHITLASGGICGIDEKILGEVRIMLRSESVSSFELMQSVVERGCRVYRSIASYPLKKEVQ